MKTILEAENAYREAERELRERQDAKQLRGGTITLTFAATGFVIFAVGGILGLFGGIDAALIPMAVGAAFAVYAVFRIHMSRMHPKPLNEDALDAAFDELEDAQKRWLRSAGFEVSDETLDAIGFDYLPDRIGDETFGSTQLLHRATGRVVPVVLKFELGKGYVLYGPEGVLLEEYPAKEGV